MLAPAPAPLRAGQKANTPPNTRERPPRSCYSYFMISPIRGNLTGFRVQVPSDTLNPHERPFTGMLDRHPCLASGRGRCFLSSLSLGGPPFSVLARVSVGGVLADDDRRRVVAAGVQGPA